MSIPSLGMVFTLIFAASACCCGPFAELVSPQAPEVGQNTQDEMPEGQDYYVVAATTLKMRAMPDADAPEVANLARGEKVIVTGPGVGNETISGIGGAWRPTWYNRQTGWVFDGFLLPFPPPPVACNELSQWAAEIGHAGGEVFVAGHPCSESEDDDTCDATWRTPLRGGGWYERNEGWEWGYQTIYLPGVERDAFWAAARKCMNVPKDAATLPLPSEVTTKNHGPEEWDGSTTTIVEASKWGWSVADEGYSSTIVEVVGADAKVTTGGGL